MDDIEKKGELSYIGESESSVIDYVVTKKQQKKLKRRRK